MVWAPDFIRYKEYISTYITFKSPVRTLWIYLDTTTQTKTNAINKPKHMHWATRHDF